MQHTHRNGANIMLYICTVLFIAFTFCYLYFYQADTLTYVQHVLSQGRTCYDNLIGAIVLTAVLYGVMLLMRALVGTCRTYPVLACFPPLLLLAFLTNTGEQLSFPFVGFVCALLLYALALWGLHAYTEKSKRQTRKLWLNKPWGCFALLGAMFFFVGSSGNGDDAFRYRLRVERCMAAEQFAEACTVGQATALRDTSLSMLRAYALARRQLLGEKLFTYPLIGGSRLLLPAAQGAPRLLLLSDSLFTRYFGAKRQTAIEPLTYLQAIEKRKPANRHYIDYLLCAYLLDKRLDDFVRTLVRHVPIDATLPKHYREALLLYTHTHTKPLVEFHDTVLEADYQDYAKLQKLYSDKRLRQTKLAEVYGNTYWYYYQYAPLHKPLP